MAHPVPDKREIILHDSRVAYHLRRSRQARTLRLTVRTDGSLVATQPWGVSMVALEQFIREKAAWVLRTIARVQARPALDPVSDRSHYLAHRGRALAHVRERVSCLNTRYGFSFGAITIRNQRSRWGSCSRKGNLSFNYRIVFLPAMLADYIIIHELCHLGEFNHSRKFWELVARTMPDYRTVRKELKNSIRIA